MNTETIVAITKSQIGYEVQAYRRIDHIDGMLEYQQLRQDGEYLMYFAKAQPKAREVARSYVERITDATGEPVTLIDRTA